MGLCWVKGKFSVGREMLVNNKKNCGIFGDTFIFWARTVDNSFKPMQTNQRTLGCTGKSIWDTTGTASSWQVFGRMKGLWLRLPFCPRSVRTPPLSSPVPLGKRLSWFVGSTSPWQIHLATWRHASSLLCTDKHSVQELVESEAVLHRFCGPERRSYILRMQQYWVEEALPSSPPSL